MKTCVVALLLLLSFELQAQFKISGTVKDQDGELLIGAAVRLIDTSKGSLSDVNGNFLIKDVEAGEYFIEISYLGYLTKQKNIKVSEDVSVNFKMSTTREELDEIIVTANRRLEDIQKTASAVSAISSKRIEQLQVKQFGELNSIAPNFKVYDDGTTGSFSLFASRGISTIDFVPVVGLYVDDVPYFTTYAFPLALSDVAQIEVLRGPQGTLYGRNALAGVVKITTKKPTNQLNGYVTAGLGNLNLQEYGLGLNLPLKENKLFFRVNANYTDRDGFVKNEFNGKDLQNRQTIDGTARLKYFANDHFSIALTYGLQFRESDGYAFALATPGNSFQGILKNNRNQVNFNEDVFREVTTHNTALKINYDFDQFNFTSVTAYQYTEQSRRDEFDYSPLSIQSVEGDFDLRNISQEFRLSSNQTANLDWTAGVFLYRSVNLNDDILFSGVDNIQDPLAPYQRIDDSERIQQGLAVFGQSSYKVDANWTITGGLRFDYEEASATVDRVFTTPLIPEGNIDESAEFTAVSPKLSVSYQTNSDIFLFANVARGYRPGGINTFVTNPEDAPFDPENTINYELGFKSNLLNNRLKWNVTGFIINYSDQQVFNLLDAATFNFGTDNIGESRSGGIEVESEWVASRGLTFNMNLGYLSTEITEFIATGVDPNTFQEIEIDESGNDLPVSPAFNGNLNVNYILPVSDKINIESSIDYQYQSDMYWDVSNAISQDAYGLLNLRLGVTTKNADLFIWAKNVTDVAYFSYGYGVSGFNAASFGLPRTYGITLTGKF
ncbi:MAG: TonB-dependent receptor [Bacteroidota bacterium]